MEQQPIRAVYHNGQLTLLDDVNLAEGEVIALVILTEREKIRLALGDLLVEGLEPPVDSRSDEELMREIEEGFKGQPPLSDDIIKERY